MAKAASGMRTKFASNARQTSLRFRSGSSISLTVRLRPTANMVETTKTRSVIGITLFRNSTCASACERGSLGSLAG